MVVSVANRSPLANRAGLSPTPPPAEANSRRAESEATKLLKNFDSEILLDPIRQFPGTALVAAGLCGHRISGTGTKPVRQGISKTPESVSTA